MPDAYSIAVAVATGDHNIEIVIRKFNPFGDRYCATVQAVNAVGVNESWQVRRAPDARDNDQILRLDPETPGSHFERFQNAEVATTRTPVGINNPFVCLNR